MRKFFTELKCFLGFHDWNGEQRRQHVRYECEHCGAERWELNSI